MLAASQIADPLAVRAEEQARAAGAEPDTAAARGRTRYAIATEHRVVLDLGDQVMVRRWCDVDSASLDAQSAELTIRWADGSGATTVTLSDAKPQAFARVFRERVQSSVVHAETVKLPGGGTVRVAVRRDENDALFSEVIGDGRVRLDDPATASVIVAAEARVRESVGLPI